METCELCGGTGEVMVDAQYCGGCEICGNREAHIEKCLCQIEQE